MSTTAPKEKRRRMDDEGAEGKPILDISKPTKLNHWNENFQEGDITFISAEGWSFKTQKYHLQAASPVFRDMMSASENENESVIAFSDSSIETSKSTYLLLLSFADSDAQEYVWDDDWYSYALFLLKYECAAAILRLKKRFTPRLSFIDPERQIDNDSAFAIGAILTDPELCAMGIVYGHADRWCYEDEDHLGLSDGVHNMAALDLRAAPLQYTQRLLPRYGTALLRAAINKDICGTQKEREEIAVEFLRLVKE